MKKITNLKKSFIVSALAVCLGLTCCGDNKKSSPLSSDAAATEAPTQGNDATATEAPTQGNDATATETPTQQKVDTLVIKKNIYLGMPVETAEKIFTDYIQGSPLEKIAKFRKTDEGSYQLVSPMDEERIKGIKKDDENMSRVTPDSELVEICAELQTDNSGKVTYIFISMQMSDIMFKTADLDLKDFVQMFINAYGVNEMTTQAEYGKIPIEYTHSSPQGWDLSISYGNAIYLKQRFIPGQQNF